MIFFEIQDNKNQQASDLCLVFKNKSHELFFNLNSSDLFSTYDLILSEQQNNLAIRALCFLFAKEIIFCLGHRIAGGIFSLSEIRHSATAEKETLSIIVHNSNQDTSSFSGVFSGSSEVISQLTTTLVNYAVLEKLPQLSGQPTLVGELPGNTKYKAALLEKLCTFHQRTRFLHVCFSVNQRKLDMYFPENTIRHFASFVLKKEYKEKLPVNKFLAQIFVHILTHYFEKQMHILVQALDHNIVYLKKGQFMELALGSKENLFSIYIPLQHKNIITKILLENNFTPQLNENSQEATLSSQEPLPFAVELGVAYLNLSELKNLAQGDIIVFDKTCVAPEQDSIETGVVNLNGSNLVISLATMPQCTVTHFTKDW